MIKNEIFIETADAVSRLQLYGISDEEENKLNEEQIAVTEKLKLLFEEKQTVLLQGVTGSGKTEVYIEFIKNMFRRENRFYIFCRRSH